MVKMCCINQNSLNPVTNEVQKYKEVTTVPTINLLNQALAGHRPVHVSFLEIDLVHEVCVSVSVCSPPRLLITSGVMWHDMDPT